MNQRKAKQLRRESRRKGEAQERLARERATATNTTPEPGIATQVIFGGTAVVSPPPTQDEGGEN